MSKQTAARAAIGLAFLTFISKILGFVREIVISYYYGASAMSDAYSMANSVAVLIVTGLASGIMTAYIPMAMGIEDEKKRDAFTSSVLNTVVLTSLVAAFICILFSKEIVNILGMGFSSSTKEYTVIILRFVFVSAVCIFAIYILTGYLNTKGNFSFGGLQLIITNLLFIFAVLLSRNNPWYLGVGHLVAYVVPTILGIYLVRKYGFSYSTKLSVESRTSKNLLMVSLIAFLGTNVIKFHVMLDRVFASHLQEGTVAAINYAFTLISIFPEVFILSMATVGYPKLSKWHSEGDNKAFGEHINSLLIQTLIILMPIMIAFLELGRWGVQIMFERGAFNAADTLLTTDILYGYSYGMLGMGVSFILCRAFYARKEEWIPAFCFGVGFLLNLGANLLWGRNDAYTLSLTTSIAVFLSTVLMLAILLVKVKEIKLAYLGVNIFKILFTSIIMFVIIRLGTNLLSENIEAGGLVIKIFLVGGIAFVSGLCYLAALYLCKVNEFKLLMGELLNKIKTEK